MANQLVSVIVPVFNRAAVVGKAVESLRRQTLDGFEIVVVDDGSSDGSAEVAERAGGGRVRVVRHTENRGIPAARNTGLEAARGRYIAWLDSDDLARPDRLARQVKFLEANPDVALVGSAAGLVGPDGRRKWGARMPFLTHEALAPALLFRSPFQQSSVMGTAAVLKSFPYRAEFPVCEDLDMFIRVSREHRLANLKEVLIDRRLHPGQINKVENELVRDRKRVLLGESLRQLEVDPSPSDLDRHITLGAPQKRLQSREFLAWSESWMKRLRQENERSRRYDSGGLALSCARAWLEICRLSMHGDQRLAAARAMLASSLTLGFGNRYGVEWLAAALPAIVGSG